MDCSVSLIGQFCFVLSLPLMRTFTSQHQPLTACLCALALLLIVYLPTLQTIPNGADHYYMADVGETQVVLNVWGTLHATGYPLYVMLSSALVAILKLFGMSSAAAPAFTSLIWNISALALLYALLLHISRRMWWSALVVALFGITRTVWIHSVIAEIYSFSLIFLLLLLLIALRRTNVQNRIYWLAFIGGVGVFNHRALIMVVPALLYAVWDELMAKPRQIPRIIIICLLLGLLGFLPYLYLPLRAWSGAAWVYGDPDTWQGFLDQFLGREADRYVGLRDSWQALGANFTLVTNVLITDITLPGIALGMFGLRYGITQPAYRRPAITLLLSAAFAYGFHVLFYSDILSALILPILVSMVCGWLFGVIGLMDAQIWHTKALQVARYVVILGAAAVFAAVSYPANFTFIGELTTDLRGVETLEQLRATPAGSTLMIGWGTRHSAAGFLQEVIGELQDVTLVDHNADIATAAQNGTLVTPEYSFYTFPLSWWEKRLGARVYLEAAAPYLVRVNAAPTFEEPFVDGGMLALHSAILCDAKGLNLYVNWYAQAQPTRDLGVFVHLLDGDGNVIAQGDQAAPVYGWYPLTLWQAGEVVRDIYPLPRLENAAQIRFGMYHQEADGSFVNDVEYTIAVICDG
jgi:hypothetical protein